MPARRLEDRRKKSNEVEYAVDGVLKTQKGDVETFADRLLRPNACRELDKEIVTQHVICRRNARTLHGG